MRRLFGFAFASTMAIASSAHAAEPSVADMAAARVLGTEGIKLANKGKCAEAVEKLEKAERFYHAPTTLGRLGECHVDLGKLVLGSEELRRVVREPLPDRPPKAFVEARARAEKVLNATQPRIAYMHLNVAAPSDVKPEATLDGDAISPAVIGTDYPVDPGDHVIKATAPGYLETSKQFSMKEAEKKDISLTLEKDPNAPKTPPPTANGQGNPAMPTNDGGPRGKVDLSPESRTNVPAYAAFAIGIVGLAVGTVSGLIFLKDASDLETNCPDKKCPSSHSGDLSTTKQWGTISTVGFGVGAAGIIAGVVLLIAAPSSSASASADGVRFRF